MGRIELGKKGEEVAVNFLKKKGYRVVQRNYRCPMGEVDIVAKEEGDIVFVEVKTRRSLNFGLPEEAISYNKRRHLTKVALAYLAHHRLKEINCRFDTISILMEKNRVKDIQLIKAAFEAAY